MSADRRVGRRWFGLALLVPGLLMVHPGSAHPQGDARKPESKRPIPTKAQPQPKALAQPRSQPTPKAQAKRAAPRSQAAAGPSARPGGSRPTGECVHVVRSGDSVSGIAARHGVTRGALVSANRLANPAALRSGQRLKLPGCRAASPVQTAEALPGPGAGRPTPPGGAELASFAPTSLVARVGPRRVPTRLHIAVPEFSGEVEFVWPVEGPVLSGFGRRRGGWHAGVDIRAERGMPIRPAAPGIVAFSGWEGSYGNVVKIEHANGFMTLYAHNLENLVQAGDQVDSDTVIATVGRTGRATGDHVHFEIRRAGMAYNPVHLVEPRETPILVANPYSPPEPDQIPVSSLAQSPDDFELP